MKARTHSPQGDNSSSSSKMTPDYDPKQKKHHPLKSFLKLGAVILCCVGVMVAIRMQQGLMKREKEKAMETKKAGVGDYQHVERVEEPQKDSSGTPKAPEPKLTSDATDEFPDEPELTSNPNLPFNKHKPILVLSLPHNAELAIARYFSCGGVVPNELGNYWSIPEKLPISRCFYNNLRNNATITANCGDFAVYSQLQLMEPSKTKGPTRYESRCFDPVWYPKALEELYKAIPNAIILTVQQDPADWFYSLPKDLKTFWKKTCNPIHQDAFPGSTKKLEKYETFYHDYHMKLVQFVQDHEGWEYFSINWNQEVETTATRLQTKLNIPAHCWKDAIDAPLKSGANSALPPQKRPNTITYPILDVTLPKSGSVLTHLYFKCGLGLMSSVSQWTTPSNSTIEHPTQDIPIGRCIELNVRGEEPSENILKGCGKARVWGDIGYLRDRTNGGTCFYPTMNPSVLEQFATYYPNATLLHVIRDAGEWYQSAVKNNDLPNRWAAAQNCPGFPSDGTDQPAWEAFYQQHTQSIRDFAAQHPSLTYLEVPMSNEGGEMMQDTFQFPDTCWPKALPVDA